MHVTAGGLMDTLGGRIDRVAKDRSVNVMMERGCCNRRSGRGPDFDHRQASDAVADNA